MDDPVYQSLVTSKLLHRCSYGANGCLNEHDVCKKKFKKGIVPETFFDDRNFPVYKRPHDRDWNVVANNRDLTLDLKCHVNVEFCISVYAVMYLYKYLFKGSKKVTIDLNNTNDIRPDDEINLHLRGRMLSVMEAV